MGEKVRRKFQKFDFGQRRIFKDIQLFNEKVKNYQAGLQYLLTLFADFRVTVQKSKK